MALPATPHVIEDIIGYKFRSRHDLLPRALTAAGAVEEDWDGNRKLAQFGASLSEFLLHYLAFEAGVTRAYANDFKSKVATNEQRAFVATQTGISKHIKFNEQSGAPSPTVLAKAVSAIIALVFLDCGEDISIVLRTMRHLGIFTLPGQSIDPTLLSLDKLPDSLDVVSLAQSLFRGEAESQSLPVVTSNDQIALIGSPIHLRAPSHLQQPADEANLLTEVDNDLPLIQHNPSPGNGETHIELAEDQPANGSIAGAASITDGGEEASRGDTMEPTGTCPRPAKRRTSVHRAESGRRKQIREFDTHPDSDALERYLSEEVLKCQAFGQRIPQDTFLTPPVRQAVQNLSKGNTDVLARILIQIGCPCLIGGLRELLTSCKTQETRMAQGIERPFSRVERFHLIARLGHSMSHLQMLRRYHILELFKDCGGPKTPTCTMVMITGDVAGPTNKRGNPVKRSLADVTARMMEETFPEIEPNTLEYRRKYRWISDIRRLGQRLHMLETRFGEGTLGLMLDQGLAGTDVGITDAMIMAPTDTEYAKFVGILDSSQGDLLRLFSWAVLPAMQALTFGGLDEQRLFEIEKIPVDDISMYPKGSLEFLERISETM